MHIQTWLPLSLLSLACDVLAISPEFMICQVQKPAGVSPLHGCPDGTIFVSQDTKDKNAHFHSVQEAVLSL